MGSVIKKENKNRPYGQFSLFDFNCSVLVTFEYPLSPAKFAGIIIMPP